MPVSTVLMAAFNPSCASEISQTPEECDSQWQQLRIGELKREMSLLAHGLARANIVKLDALHKVFTGLTILVVLTSAFIVGLGVVSPTTP